MNMLPVDRALIIYGALADRTEPKGVRDRLSKHLMKRYIEGERDPHRLTVEGLSFLQNLYREIELSKLDAGGPDKWQARGAFGAAK